LQPFRQGCIVGKKQTFARKKDARAIIVNQLKGKLRKYPVFYRYIEKGISNERATAVASSCPFQNEGCFNSSTSDTGPD
jgi:hypothetical protein